MITRLVIKNLRGVRLGTLDGFAPLTVLTGPNSSGKSAVLDALLIAASPVPGDTLGRAVTRHPSFFGDAASWLLHRDADVATIQLWRHSVSDTFHLRVQRNPKETIARLHEGPEASSTVLAMVTFNDTGYVVNARGKGEGFVRLMDPGIAIPLHETYSRVVRAGRKSDVVQLLNVVSESITDMELLTDNGTIGLYLIEGGHGVPVELTGDGVQSFAQLALELGSVPNGLALIEEPEVYQHPRAIWQSARAIVAAVQRGVQVVLTTHSLELIDGLIDALGDEGPEMVVFNLALEDGELKSARFDRESIDAARTSLDQDLR